MPKTRTGRSNAPTRRTMLQRLRDMVVAWTTRSLLVWRPSRRRSAAIIRVHRLSRRSFAWSVGDASGRATTEKAAYLDALVAARRV